MQAERAQAGQAAGDRGRDNGRRGAARAHKVLNHAPTRDSTPPRPTRPYPDRGNPPPMASEAAPPEEWRAVPGVAGLEVSSEGRVRRYHERAGWTQPHFVPQNALGYCRFTHNGVHMSVHHAVCSSFHGPQPSAAHTPDHLTKYDGDWIRERGDNCAANLAWATKREQSLNRKPEAADRGGKPVLLRHQSWGPRDPPLRFTSALAASKFLGVGSSRVSAGVTKGWKVHEFSITRAETEQQGDLPGEVWKQASPKLYVSSMGRTQSKDKVGSGWGLKLTPKPTAGRLYARVNNTLVHVLVASLFCGEKPSRTHTVDHKNGDKTDNQAANLRWATKSLQVLNRTGQATHASEKRPIEVQAPGTTGWVRYSGRMDAVRAIHKSSGLKLSPGSMVTCAKKGYRYKMYRFRLVVD